MVRIELSDQWLQKPKKGEERQTKISEWEFNVTPSNFKTMHTKKWFISRIKKRVFRNKTSCNCHTCTRNWKEGLIIGNMQHAIYLYDCQCEMNINYRDKK